MTGTQRQHKGVALVTGGGTGVGKAIAHGLALAGWTVVISGRRAEVLDQAASELKAGSGRDAMAVAADVGNPASVADLFSRIDATYGRLDLLVNNAGVGAPAVPLEELSYESWSAVVAANLTGAFLCTQQAFRLMKAQQPRGGRIINNGSISATTPRPNSAPYTATKHAISGLTKSTALDGRPFDIACGQIDIGNASTEMTTTIAKGVLQANGDIAAEPMIDAGLVADAVVYMAGLPLDANVLTMTVMATKMPFVGRG
ncbi:SDR family oxidoreductase [Rhizobium sp. TRM95796]|uniref:SDR family oxidoreductase n=1 Tax=Rhizobium sp. TRM95796 TaxID=2979862 RepID=UPI0021E8FAC8|nr:SDR family oxidoreductase [Rhizobium sp. TRM95796]MCV3767859.1 SDR family oxidoreductase [Rhizobium sp. TRM95796]